MVTIDQIEISGRTFTDPAPSLYPQNAVREAYRDLYNDKLTRRLYLSPTREQAYATLSRIIDFSADFHTLPSPQVAMLVSWAKATKYRKPKAANGSTGRYFFAHLARRFNK